MSYNGSGTFLINSAGQPVVANTVISATVFNALTADLATGLSTAITKDGQTTVTANIPFGNNKITTLGAGTAATDAANLGQVQSTAAKLITVTGTDTITGSMSPQLTAYAAGQLLYFIANAANTGAVTINVDGLGAKAITRDGSTALAAGDINSGEVVVIVYDGTRFQMINAANSFGNTTINGTLTVTGNTALQANVSITSALSVGGVFAVTGAATLGSTLSVTGKSDLPTVSTASMNAAVAVITTGTVTNLTSTSASIASMNAGVALLTTATVTNLTATGASIASANVGTAVVTGLTVTNASIASVNAATATLSGNLTLSGGTANGVLYLNASKVATSGSALTFDGTTLGTNKLTATGFATLGLGAVFTGASNNATGTGVEIGYSSGASSGLIQAFNRTSSVYVPIYYDASVQSWNISGTEGMRLTSTGLGIGTSSPGARLHSVDTIHPAYFAASGTSLYTTYSRSNTTVVGYIGNGTGLIGGSNNDNFAVRAESALMFASGGATERMRLDSSGNLGLGVTPSAWQSSWKMLQVGQAAFGRFSTDYTIVSQNFFSDGANKYIGDGFATMYFQNLGKHVWRTAPNNTSGAGAALTFTDTMTLDASGNLLVGVNTATANGGVIQVSNGITFPATQSAASNANTLDDYEEGTWQGSFSPSTSGTITINTSDDTGAYTKIGRQVTVTGNFQVTSVASPVGVLVTISGLPFTIGDGTETSQRGSGSVMYYDNSTTTASVKPVDYIEGQTSFRVWFDASTVEANDSFTFTVTYFV